MIVSQSGKEEEGFLKMEGGRDGMLGRGKEGKGSTVRLRLMCYLLRQPQIMFDTKKGFFCDIKKN